MIWKIWQPQQQVERLTLALGGHAVDADGGVAVKLVVVRQHLVYDADDFGTHDVGVIDEGAKQGYAQLKA